MSTLINNVLDNLDLVAMLIAFNLMTYLAHRRARGEGSASEGLFDLPLWMAMGGVVGARLAFVAPDLPPFFRHPLDLARINGGMYFYGALVGALVPAWWSYRRGRLDFWRSADLYALYAPLAISAFRWSCLLVNRCYGDLADPPLGIRFPGLNLPRYPSELYEASILIGLFGVLMAVHSRKGRAGTTFLSFLIGYPIVRSLVDLTRIDFGSRWGASDILISLGLALAAMGLLIYRNRIRRPGPDAWRSGGEVTAWAEARDRKLNA